MIPGIREAFNHSFTGEKYEAFLRDLDSIHPGQIEFRVAETPVFVSRDFKNKMLDACERIIDIIIDPSFKEQTKNAIPAELQVPGENDHAHFIAFDFGVCLNEKGEYEPQLIEMQGFPSLFAYQVILDDVFRRHYEVPPNFDCYLNGFDRDGYIHLLRDIIVGSHDPSEVILLEIFPEKQKTRIDFFCTQDFLGIRMVCLTDLVKEGNKLFYFVNGKKTAVKRIYNRLIFDDLSQQSDEIKEKGKILFEDLDVEWIPHPNWFYRISKYTLPLIDHPYVPKTYYLDRMDKIPADLENYVLKPLFSFAGQGVVIDVKKEDIDNVKDPANWILQRKVKYADVIKTPSEPAKAEIRIFYFWKEGSRPVATNNLARLSKGKMIGVRYNKNKDWVGGTLCYFEK
jgi:hypothetical protein